MEAFLAEDAIVHFCSRKQEDISKATETLSSKFPSTKAIGSVVDVGNPKALTKWVEDSGALNDRIDVVIANVAFLGGSDEPEHTLLDNWRISFDVDMLHTVSLIESAKPFLEKSQGNIVSISSVSGRQVDFTAPGPYGAMKAAIVHYMAQLAHTLAPRKIRANTVSPGNIYIQDGFFGDVERQNKELFDKILNMNPSGRMGKREEVADAVVFLASERASYISGTNLVVDGGLCTGVQL